MSKKTLNIPFEIKPIDPEINAELLQDFDGEFTGFVQVGPNKYCYPRKFEEQAGHFYNFQVRPDDIWIVTYPRSGTTMTQEIIWLLANNLDYKKASQTPLDRRFPYLEFNMIHHSDLIAEFYKINAHSKENCAILDDLLAPAYDVLAAKTNGRRFIKTHLPLELLPPDLLTCGAKVIYVARNPKDVAASYFHLHRMFKCKGFNKDFAKFWNYFQNNLITATPYWLHVQAAWNKRNEQNVLFMFYEDMIRDMNESIRKIAKFLNVCYCDEEFKKLEMHMAFDNFKLNKSVNCCDLKELGLIVSQDFIRKGKIGGSQELFQGDLKIQADKWIQENLIKTGIVFPN